MADYSIEYLRELRDVEAFAGKIGKYLRLESLTSAVWDTPAGGGDTVFDNWKSIYDATLTAPYVASGSKAETTLAAGVIAGAQTAVLIDASTYAPLQDMAIPGAGVAGAELIVNLLTVDTGTGIVTWTTPTSTTVSIGITVYHDDTRAVQAFLDSGELNLYIHGDFVVSGEITVTERGQVLLGGNLFTFSAFATGPIAGATFHQRSLTSNTFNITANLVKQGSLAVQTVSGTATAGAHWVLGETTGGQDASFLNLVNCRSRYAYIGILVQNGWEHIIEKWQITHPVKHGVKVESATGYGYGGHDFRSIHGWETSGNADSFIYITGTDFNMWFDTKAAGFNTVFHIDGSFRDVGPQTITHTHCDNAKGISLKVEKASSNLVSGPKVSNFSGLQFTSGANPFVSIGAGVTGTVLNAVHSRGRYGGGFEDYGDDTTMTGCTVGVESNNLTAYDAFILKSTSNGATLSGCRGTRRRYGLVIDNGAANYTVTANNFGGNDLGAANLFSGARGAGTIANNEGILDHLTSIGSAPDKVGQESLVSGVWYKAINTSSSADWKQVTP